MTEEVLQLKDLREVFEDANNLGRQESGCSGASTADMLTGAGTPAKYLVQAVQERQQRNKL